MPLLLANVTQQVLPDGPPDAHKTEELEVLYRWHPWFGQVVHVHEVIEKRAPRGLDRALFHKLTDSEGLKAAIRGFERS